MCLSGARSASASYTRSRGGFCNFRAEEEKEEEDDSSDEDMGCGLFEEAEEASAGTLHAHIHPYPP